MLQNIPQINQEELLGYYRFAIKNQQNLLVFGPSGTGKTEMAIQACNTENYEPLYWNLSVSERPDIQGLPYVAENGKISAYAAPAQLPVADNRFYREKTELEKLLQLNITGALKTEIEKRLCQIEKHDQIFLLKSCEKYIRTDLSRQNIQDKLRELSESNKNSDREIVLFFDELDKAPPDVLQPLLEIMQFKTLNGRPLAIKACIATANLPDEHTHSEQISHALTNRCMIFQLTPDIKIWQQWAAEANLHPLILGFLSAPENAEYFHKKPQNNEVHTYAYATPRSWSEASKLLKAFDENETYWRSVFKLEKFETNKKIDDALTELDDKPNPATLVQTRLIASKVGENAATAFRVWLDYYNKLSPIIENIYYRHGDYLQNAKDLNPTQQMILAIGVHNKLVAELKTTDDPDKIEQMVVRTYSWLQESVADEFRICTTRSTFKSYHQLFMEKKVMDIDYYRKCQLDAIELQKVNQEYGF